MIEEMEKYAKEYKIPIMVPDGINYMLDYIKKHNVKKVLEIGTAIGYSAIRMAKVSDDIYVTTIERDEVRYNEAIKNIKKCNLEDRIKVLLVDALDVEINDKFDLIFIDAAKSQYTKFFNKFSPLLNEDGTIITDNLDFHGLRENIDNIQSRNLRQMMRKLNSYIDFLKDNEEFDTVFVNIGDGLGISTRKKNS